MQSVRPGAWEDVAKAYQGREPSTSNAGLSQWANAACVGDRTFIPNELQHNGDLRQLGVRIYRFEPRGPGPSQRGPRR